jgi:hypothetical protein
MREIPSSFSPYWAVVNRLGEVRTLGGALTFRCLFPGRHKHGDQTPSCRCWIGRDNGALMAQCLGCGASWHEIVREVGLPMSEWFPDKGGRPMKPHAQALVVARYVYKDANGKILATKTKWSPGFNGRAKEYTWSRPLEEDYRQLLQLGEEAEAVVDGPDCLSEGQFVPTKWADGTIHLRKTEEKDNPKAILLGEVKPGLYGIERLASTPKTTPIFVVEGEKDVTTLQRIGLVAVCPPNGSNSWHPDWSTAIADRPIIVVPDNDLPGHTHAVRVVGLLIYHGVRQVRVLKPGHHGYDVRPDGGDISDWLMAHKATLKDAASARQAVIELCRKLTRHELSAAQ